MQTLQLCSENYKKWKEIALTANSVEEAKEAAKKAFFWLEMHCAVFALQVAEANALSDEAKIKVLKARMRICQKMANYASQLLRKLKNL